jgi:hypothetical protein
MVREVLRERLAHPRPGEPLAHATGEVAAVHASHLDLAEGPRSFPDPEWALSKPCLIEPHRHCYNSGYCRKLGH